MAKQVKEQIQAAIRGYVLAHLAEITEDFAGLQEDIANSTIHPGRFVQIDERKVELEKLAAEKLAYIERIIRDLRAIGHK